MASTMSYHTVQPLPSHTLPWKWCELNIDSLKVSAAEVHHQGKHYCPANLPAPSPCLQMAIMNRNRSGWERRLIWADVQEVTLGYLPDKQWRWTVVSSKHHSEYLYCGQLTCDPLQVSLLDVFLKWYVYCHCGPGERISHTTNALAHRELLSAAGMSRALLYTHSKWFNSSLLHSAIIDLLEWLTAVMN